MGCKGVESTLYGACHPLHILGFHHEGRTNSAEIIKAALSSKPVTDDTNKYDSTFDPMEVEMADNSTDGQYFNPADLFGKILAFINQVCASPQACMYFHKLFQQENLPSLQLLKWVHTCWALVHITGLQTCVGTWVWVGQVWVRVQCEVPI